VPVPNPLSALTTDVDTLIARVNQFAFPIVNGTVPAPPCRQQGPFDVSGERTQYPHLKAK
jgi:hypothetical protein